MSTVQFEYCDVGDYDNASLYDTVMVLDEVMEYDYLDEPVRELFFAVFFLKKVNDEIKVWRFCRMMWRYDYANYVKNSEDTLGTLLESIRNYMEIGYVAVHTKDVLIDSSFIPLVEYVLMNEV